MSTAWSLKPSSDTGSSHRAYVARVGRAIQVEIDFIVPQDLPPKNIGEWDLIRDEVGIAIGEEGNDRWLTIAFT